MNMFAAMAFGQWCGVSVGYAKLVFFDSVCSDPPKAHEMHRLPQCRRRQPVFHTQFCWAQQLPRKWIRERLPYSKSRLMRVQQESTQLQAAMVKWMDDDDEDSGGRGEGKEELCGRLKPILPAQMLGSSSEETRLTKIPCMP
jgi:hypothetical protein